MAYTPALTAALGGVTLSQLKEWRSPRRFLLAPEASRGGRVLYSWRDLIAIRTFGQLRAKVPLQRIRKSIDTLRQIENVEHLCHYQLMSDGSTIWWRHPEEGDIDLLKKPGQYHLTMQDVFEPFTARHGAQVVPLRHPKQGVVVDPEVLGGFPVIQGTRIPYDTVSSLAADGADPQSIRYFYPSVTDIGISGAVAFDQYVSEYNRPAA